MMAPRRVGDFPTQKLDAAELARYARDADARVRLGIPPEAAGEPGHRPGSAPEIDVSIEVEEPVSEEALGREGEHSTSEVRLARPGKAFPAREAVPVVVVSKDDLSWFGIDEQAQSILDRIDGRATVGDILETLTFPAADALVVLQELVEHKVIELR